MILLAKHSQSAVDPATSPTTWVLSTAGRRRAVALAASVRLHTPTRVFSSPEPKARETAEIVAATLRVDVAVLDALREHERPSLPFATSREAFEREIADAFARPTEVVFGGESIEAARRRFQETVERIVATTTGETPLVVTHGTVLATYVAGLTGHDPFALWRGLDLPSWIALDVDARAIVDSWRVTPRPDSLND